VGKAQFAGPSAIICHLHEFFLEDDFLDDDFLPKLLLRILVEGEVLVLVGSAGLALSLAFVEDAEADLGLRNESLFILAVPGNVSNPFPCASLSTARGLIDATGVADAIGSADSTWISVPAAILIDCSLSETSELSKEFLRVTLSRRWKYKTYASDVQTFASSTR
jgi:hypothetical protein